MAVACVQTSPISFVSREKGLRGSDPQADLWPFYGFLCKRFSLSIKVYQGWALQGKPYIERKLFT